MSKKYIFRAIGANTNIAFLEARTPIFDPQEPNSKSIIGERYLLNSGAVYTDTDLLNPDIKQMVNNQLKSFSKTPLSNQFYMDFDVKDDNSVIKKYIDFISGMSCVTVPDEFGKETNSNARNPMFILVDVSASQRKKINTTELKARLINLIQGLDVNEVTAIAYFLGYKTSNITKEKAKDFIYTKIEEDAIKVDNWLEKDATEIDLITNCNLGLELGYFKLNDNKFYEINGINCGTDIHSIYATMKQNSDSYNYLKGEIKRRTLGEGNIDLSSGIAVPINKRAKGKKDDNDIVKI